MKSLCALAFCLRAAVEIVRVALRCFVFPSVLLKMIAAAAAAALFTSDDCRWWLLPLMVIAVIWLQVCEGLFVQTFFPPLTDVLTTHKHTVDSARHGTARADEPLVVELKQKQKTLATDQAPSSSSSSSSSSLWIQSSKGGGLILICEWTRGLEETMMMIRKGHHNVPCGRPFISFQ
jgi:hypothetical protein